MDLVQFRGKHIFNFVTMIRMTTFSKRKNGVSDFRKMSFQNLTEKNICHIIFSISVRHRTVVLPNAGAGDDVGRTDCQRIFGIIEHFLELVKAHELEWLVVVDDETKLGVDRILELISCYHHAERIVIGKRLV